MRARIGVPTVLVTSTVLAVLIGMSAATGQTVLQLSVSNHSLKARFVDHDSDGLRLGDQVAFRATLTDAEGMDVGTAYGDCLVHRPIRGPETGLWTCTYVLDLADGDVMLKGLDPRGPGEYEVAVVGGTGGYANASGDATFTDTSEGTDMEIRLSS